MYYDREVNLVIDTMMGEGGGGWGESGYRYTELGGETCYICTMREWVSEPNCRYAMNECVGVYLVIDVLN